MGERMPERAGEATALVDHDEDRAFAVVALAVCALSGLIMGLLVQGRLLGFLVAALAPLAGAVGWWLRGVVR